MTQHPRHEDRLGAPHRGTLVDAEGVSSSFIEVQDDVEQMGLKTLLGLVTGLESNEFTIQVSQGGQAIATTSVDEIAYSPTNPSERQYQ